MNEFKVTYILDECLEFEGVYDTLKEANEKKEYLLKIFKEDMRLDDVFIEEIK